ncbi:AarF/UbiB family protein [Pseudothauera nasutitermitis]|uniref:AarF/UbiB family protein n=1 Tax=Pseudothauera nasutitermitis TaxID=2565930 RepID=UPI001454D225|nr:lipopolysaccharide kinase InaA family protein [Pseudothauera nasutitermitis]
MHLRQFVQGLDKVVYPGHVFYLSPELSDERRQIADFLDGKRRLTSLYFKENIRAVYLLDGNAYVLKHGFLKGWKYRLKRHLGVTGHGGLCSEFINLRRLGSSALAPNVYGVGYRRYGILREEFLVAEFHGGMLTIDAFLKMNSSLAEWVLVRVVGLFRRMLDDGFVHMDPNPMNILVSDEGEMRFIDFEFCSFEASDRGFVLSFALGYFYHFWFRRFLGEEHYDHLVLGVLVREERGMVDEKFLNVYRRFKQGKIGRKESHAYLLSPARRQAFVGACQIAAGEF